MLPFVVAGTTALAAWGATELIEKGCENGTLDDETAAWLRAGVAVVQSIANVAVGKQFGGTNTRPSPGGMIESMHPTTRAFLQSRINSG